MRTLVGATASGKRPLTNATSLDAAADTDAKRAAA
jgi:hypothetical protein